MCRRFPIDVMNGGRGVLAGRLNSPQHQPQVQNPAPVPEK